VLALRTGLDVGAWVLPDAHAMDFVGTDFGPPFNGLLLDLEPGAVVVTGDQTGVDIFGVLEPTEVTTVADAAGYEPAIIGLLGTAGLLAVLLVLVAVVRRRRDELAIYRVLGFSPRQLRATIAVQGVLFATAAAVIGLPVGVVVGRFLWRALADTLGVVVLTGTAWTRALLFGVAVLVVGALSSIPPALAAGRQRHTLRDERS
jgi:ABC-type antimicrobial peptide transport system permease subunit